MAAASQQGLPSGIAVIPAVCAWVQMLDGAVRRACPGWGAHHTRRSLQLRGKVDSADYVVLLPAWGLHAGLRWSMLSNLVHCMSCLSLCRALLQPPACGLQAERQPDCQQAAWKAATCAEYTAVLHALPIGSRCQNTTCQDQGMRSWVETAAYPKDDLVQWVAHQLPIQLCQAMTSGCHQLQGRCSHSKVRLNWAKPAPAIRSALSGGHPLEGQARLGEGAGLVEAHLQRCTVLDSTCATASLSRWEVRGKGAPKGISN